MESNTEVIFVYSEMQMDTDKEICKKSGVTFTCGNVSVGGSVKKYTKMIDPSYLSAMVALYPDTKIVTRGIKSKISYVDVVTV